MEVDRLFVHTLRDLEEHVGATDEYKVLMSAALLRKLLVDGSHLLGQVNRTHRLQVTFHTSNVSPVEKAIYDASPIFWVLEDSLDPESPLAYRPFNATLDQFLKRRVMYFKESWLTIKDVIGHLANIAGAVHSGSPRNEQQRALQAAESFYGRGGLPGTLSQIKAIGRITVRGLSPLRDVVVAGGGATWASVEPDGSVELREANGNADDVE